MCVCACPRVCQCLSGPDAKIWGKKKESVGRVNECALQENGCGKGERRKNPTLLIPKNTAASVDTGARQNASIAQKCAPTPRTEEGKKKVKIVRDAWRWWVAPFFFSSFFPFFSFFSACAYAQQPEKGAQQKSVRFKRIQCDPSRSFGFRAAIPTVPKRKKKRSSGPQEAPSERDGKEEGSMSGCLASPVVCSCKRWPTWRPVSFFFLSLSETPSASSFFFCDSMFLDHKQQTSLREKKKESRRPNPVFARP